MVLVGNVTENPKIWNGRHLYKLGRIAVHWPHGGLTVESIMDGTVTMNYTSFHTSLLVWARIIFR